MIFAATETVGVALAVRPPVQRAGALGHPLLVLAAVALTLLLSSLLARGDAARTRSALVAARHENSALRARQVSLREQTLEVTERLGALQTAWSRHIPASTGMPGEAEPPTLP